MLNVAIAGAAGRMGQSIIGLLAHESWNSRFQLVGALEAEGHECLGKSFGSFVFKDATWPVSLVSDPNLPAWNRYASEMLQQNGAMISFATPTASMGHAQWCCEHRVPIVIGTTGLDRENVERLKALAKHLPIVRSNNMSAGMNLLAKQAADIARALGEPYAVEIIEEHHDQKKDAPSGSAIMLAYAIITALGHCHDQVLLVKGRDGFVGIRSQLEIGIHAVRGGNIVGNHTVKFIGASEIIELHHHVQSRDVFAEGALRAALWVTNQEPGFYDMRDVLGLR